MNAIDGCKIIKTIRKQHHCKTINFSKNNIFFAIQTKILINIHGSFIISRTCLPPTTPYANKEFAVYLNDNYEMRSGISPVNGMLSLDGSKPDTHYL